MSLVQNTIIYPHESAYIKTRTFVDNFLMEKDLLFTPDHKHSIVNDDAVFRSLVLLLKNPIFYASKAVNF